MQATPHSKRLTVIGTRPIQAKLPVGELKIDRSFVASVLDHSSALTLIATIISLAHAFKLEVVAEGVETEEQAKIFNLLRCDQMQG